MHWAGPWLRYAPRCWVHIKKKKEPQESSVRWIHWNHTFGQVDYALPAQFCGFSIGKYIFKLRKRKCIKPAEIVCMEMHLLSEKSLPESLHPVVYPSPVLTETPTLSAPLPATDWQKPLLYSSAQQPCLLPACHTGNKPQHKNRLLLWGVSIKYISNYIICVCVHDE